MGEIFECVLFTASLAKVCHAAKAMKLFISKVGQDYNEYYYIPVSNDLQQVDPDILHTVLLHGKRVVLAYELLFLFCFCFHTRMYFFHTIIIIKFECFYDSSN